MCIVIVDGCYKDSGAVLRYCNGRHGTTVMTPCVVLHCATFHAGGHEFENEFY